MAAASPCATSRVTSHAYYIRREQLNGKRQVRRALVSSTMSQRRRLDGVSLTGHFGCVNAVNFSNNGGQLILSGQFYVRRQRLDTLALFVRISTRSRRRRPTSSGVENRGGSVAMLSTDCAQDRARVEHLLDSVRQQQRARLFCR